MYAHQVMEWLDNQAVHPGQMPDNYRRDLKFLREAIRKAVKYHMGFIGDFYDIFKHRVLGEPLFTDDVVCIPPYNSIWVDWKTSKSAGIKRQAILCHHFNDHSHPHRRLDFTPFTYQNHNGWDWTYIPIIAHVDFDKKGESERSVSYSSSLTPEEWDQYGNPDKNDKKDRGQTGAIRHMAVHMTAMDMLFSFLNCKNVKTIPVDPDKKLLKKRAKRNKLPILRYHVLKVTGVKIKQDGTIGRGNRDLPLHTVCGHIKDYTDKGLFGKIKGRFFFAAHLRGSADHGMVMKDYETVPEERHEQTIIC